MQTSILHSAVVNVENVAIFSFVSDGTIMSWNRGAERLFGYEGTEAIKKLRFQDFIHDSDILKRVGSREGTVRRGELAANVSSRVEVLADLVGSSSSEEGVWTLRAKSGNLITSMLSISVSKSDKDGRPQIYLAVATVREHC
jgi:PAS domain-containing protein